MKVAVFTSRYPARVASFFERDMSALRAAGADIDIYSVGPEDKSLWKYSQGLLKSGMPRERIHHLGIGESMLRGTAKASTSPGALLDAAAVMWSALRFGPAPIAKTAFVLPKAWAWAADRAMEYDHVFAYWGNYAGTCAYLFHRLAGRDVPFTIWLHAGVDLYRTPVFMAQKLRYADNIVTCCEFNQEFIRKSFGASVPEIESKVHVCHHGLDLKEFSFKPDNRPGNVVMAVGRLAAHKGFDYLLQAAAILSVRGVSVIVDFVGDGEERKALERLAAELRIAGRVRFRGWQALPGVRQAMQEATILVHPSDGLGDGLPNVIREAMALGTPVIASDVAGIPDALRGGCGVLVPPKNPAALADAIEALLADRTMRGGIAEHARRRVEERYDMWHNGARLARLLRSTRRNPGREVLAA